MAVLDWLQQMLGGGQAGEDTAAAGRLADMQPGVSQWLQNVVSGDYVRQGLPSSYDPGRSFAQNALDPRGLEAALNVVLGVGGGSGLGIKAPVRAATEATAAARTAGAASEAPRGLLGPEPAGVRLEPAQPNDVGYPYGRLGPGSKVYKIVGPEGHTGILQARIQGDTAIIDDIFDISGGRNALGTGNVRDLLQQFRADNPGIKTISGERVSGARFGGETVEPGTGTEVTMRIPEAPRGRRVAGGG
jgi:hypothetical protein